MASKARVKTSLPLAVPLDGIRCCCCCWWWGAAEAEEVVVGGAGGPVVLGRGRGAAEVLLVREEGRLGTVGPVALVVDVGRLATLRPLSSGFAVVRGGGGTAALGLVVLVGFELGAWTALVLFSPAGAAAVEPVGLPLTVDSRALVEGVGRTTLGVFLSAGAGRALNVEGFFSSGWFASFFMRSSLAAFNFAAIASPGSWKVDVVGAFFDLGGGGGVGKERLTGLGLLCGIVASFFC